MKKYCLNCKYFSRYGLLCNAPANKIKVDKFWGVKGALLKPPIIKNEDNNCEDFKPSLLYRLLTFLKLK